MKAIKIWIEAARLRTLPVSVAGVVISIAIAQWCGKLEWKAALICLVFAVLAQVTSNFANEYYDYLRGTDKVGRVGPRRGVTEGDIKPVTLRNVTYATLAAACAVGISSLFLAYGGWWMLPVGVVIAVFALAYSAGPYPLSYHGLGELAVFVFFGLVPVNLTFYLQAGFTSPVGMACAALASIAIGLMAVNVLLVNNYRDVDDDREAGKNTSVVIFGRKAAAAAYLINGFAAMAMLTPMWLYVGYVQGKWWVIAVPLIYLTMHTMTWHKLTTLDGAALNPLLGATARAMLVFTVLLAVAILV